MFRIGICDDEPFICSEIESIIFDYSKSLSEKIDIEVFNSGEELYDYMKSEISFDLIFLDIELYKLSGIELGKKIREEMKNDVTQIVYISSKENYAMELFEVRPLNFLIKPAKAEKIISSIIKAMELLNKLNYYFTYKQGHNTYRKAIKDIIYFTSDNRQVKMVTVTEEVVFYGTLPHIHLQLENYRFFFCHKSYLVNYYHVTEPHYDRFIMSNGHILNISSPLIVISFNYTSNIRKVFFSVLSIYMILMLIEGIVWMMSGYTEISILQSNEKYSSAAGMIIAKILMYIAALAIRSYRNIKSDTYISNIYWLSILFIPITSLLIILSVIEMTDIHSINIFLIISGLLLMNFFVFYLYDSLIEKQEERREKAMLIQQGAFYQKQLENMEASLKTVKAFKHDVKNYLYALNSLVESGKKEAALNHISQMVGALSVDEGICLFRQHSD